MDLVAVTALRARYQDAIKAAETYRDAAENSPHLRDFYAALAFTYERSGREMRLMLDTVDRICGVTEIAA